MHSKVIVASLACLLASTFCGRAANDVACSMSHDAKRTTINYAPSVGRGYFTIKQNVIDSGDYIDTEYIYDGELDNFVVLERSNSLLEVIKNVDDDGRVQVLVKTPQIAGAYSLSFGLLDNYQSGNNPDSIATLFVYSDGIHDCVSAASPDDAKSLYFLSFMATDEERGLLNSNLNNQLGELEPIVADPFPGGPKPIIGNGSLIPSVNLPFNPPDSNSSSKFNAIKRYNDFVYGDRSDWNVSSSKENSSSTKTDVIIKVKVKYKDQNNHIHPVNGANVVFSHAGSDLIDFNKQQNIFGNSTPDNYTDSNGECVFTVGSQFAKTMYYESLEFRVYSESKATVVKDNNGITFSYCYADAPSNTYGGFLPARNRLSKYKTINFNVTITSGLSDRADAFEISQAQLLPYTYCKDFNHTMNSITTTYPAVYSAYTSSDEDKMIMIQKEDYASWDVLNHEYGHYICDTLNLCRRFPNEMPHDINENLVDRYGLHDGLELAFSEGLATYFAVASQMYDTSILHFNGVGDEKYQDDFRNIVVDYNLYPDEAVCDISGGEGVESRVTGLLVKMLDNKYREDDHVSLNHTNMWYLLTNNEYGHRSICRFLEDLLKDDDYSFSVNDFQTLMTREGISAKSDIAKWTIMIYMCGSTLEYYQGNIYGEATADIQEMLSVGDQSDYVNVIIQTGGCWHWGLECIPSNGRAGRFHIKNGELVPEEDCYELGLANMGESETFESFLNWGLEKYPAEKTGVILWNHGYALRGVCADAYFNGDKLLNSEANEAFQNVFTQRNIDKLEFIGYDACLMQLQDVAEFNSHYFNYMIASEGLEPDGGWAYDKWLPSLYMDEDTETILDTVAWSYVLEYQDTDWWETYVTCSVLDLSMMTNYYSKFEHLCEVMFNNALQYDTEFYYAAYNSYSYVPGMSWLDYQVMDCVDYMYHLLEKPHFSEFSYEISDVITAIEELVITCATLDDISCGLLIHTCIENRYFEKYYPAEETHFNTWRNIWMFELPPYIEPPLHD